MLIVSLPNDATEGVVPINGRPSEFKIDKGYFHFRPKGSGDGVPFDSRKILTRRPNPPETVHICE